MLKKTADGLKIDAISDSRWRLQESRNTRFVTEKIGSLFVSATEL